LVRTPAAGISAAGISAAGICAAGISAAGISPAGISPAGVPARWRAALGRHTRPYTIMTSGSASGTIRHRMRGSAR
jgi:hypothetical protein